MNALLTKKRVIPLSILLVGVLAGYLILSSADQKPKGFKKAKAKRVRVVEVRELKQGNVIPFWQTSGFVMPAESVQVYARVSGNIDQINPRAVPGEQLKKGQWLATLEPLDFELALASQQAQLAQAQANYALEEANQIIAKEELALLNTQSDIGIDESLVLRKPQLTAAKAKVSVAEHNLQRAQINLQRTKVLMPFDGTIMTKAVGQASKVSNNTLLFSVVNTQSYWLEVKIPHKFLPLLDVDKLADVSQLRLWGEGKARTARIVSILPELDNKDRQVKVLLAIDQPLLASANSPQVFINDFLNVELKGHAINDAWVIQYPWLQPDNTMWVVDKSNLLQKRAVEVLFKGRDLIYIRANFESGDRALAEKPGIAAAGLQVRAKQKRVKKQGTNGKNNQKPNNKEATETPTVSQATHDNNSKNGKGLGA